MKENSVFIFGAGASKACGGPLTDEILYDAFCDEAVRAILERPKDVEFVRECLSEHFHVPKQGASLNDYPSLTLRVPICRGVLSCGQSGSFNSGEVKAVAQEFHKDYGFGGSSEKFRKGIAECNGDDLFRRGQSWPNGTNPGAE